MAENWSLREASSAVLGVGDARIEIERDFPDLHLVPRLKTLALELFDHAHRPETVLDVGERVGVLEIVAPNQALDRVPRDLERVLAGSPRHDRGSLCGP